MPSGQGRSGLQSPLRSENGPRCYNCGKTGHLSRNCRAPRSESSGHNQGSATGRKPTNTKSVLSAKQTPDRPHSQQQWEDPLGFLASSSSDSEDDSSVHVVRVEDKGSHPKCARVNIQGVPAYGIVDSGADITILGSELFKKVAAVAKLKKKDFKPADKTPHNYDRQPFSLDGRMDLDVTFQGKTICTPIYIKMDAPDQLLLSQGVCRQLGIISYHPKVEVWRGGRQARMKATTQQDAKAKVPTVRVRLLQTTRVPPRQSTVVTVQVPKANHCRDPLLIEGDTNLEESTGLIMDPALVQSSNQGLAQVLLRNPLGFPKKLKQGMQLGTASTVIIVTPDQQESGACVPGHHIVPRESSPPLETSPQPESPPAPFEEMNVPTQNMLKETISTEQITSPRQQMVSATPVGAHPGTQPVVCQVSITAREQERKEILSKLLQHEGANLPQEERDKLHMCVLEQHEAFAIEDKERGETNLTQFQIDTGNALPKKQPLQRTPFAVRQEVARQLKDMQQTGVIQPSNSPWASPIVLARKKDGSLRFCVDYRHLNSVTKADTFPLPRIDDLLDQLGKCKYFSTLDMAAGYWQIPDHLESREKTAFVTHRGLYEFRVMPFGLRNAPAAFQRLMEQVLRGLNPEEGPDFVAAYIDDVLIFSQTFEKHLHHLTTVLEALKNASLKLKVSKCRFIRQEVEYLGHLITADGLKLNPALTTAVTEFPTPLNIKGIRQFVGLASYYRRFIANFARIAHPLHALTRKGVRFEWTPQCQEAFSTQKQTLTTPPVLAYPDFDKDFILETDASITGLGAILSQKQCDGRIHPIAFASRALSAPETNYGITELETLAVVWACSHFHAYLYGHNMTVYTDHSAVRAILETPSPSGKHARWWSKVYGSGVNSVEIVYRSGKDNTNADALSRNPQLPAPADDVADTDVQIASITSRDPGDLDITALLAMEPTNPATDEFGSEQRKDPVITEIIAYLEQDELPSDQKRARKVAAQSSQFALIDGILYYVDQVHNCRKRVVVPSHLQQSILQENHSGPMAGHFSGARVHDTLSRRWWWEGMYTDCLKHCKNCPQCAVVSGTGRVQRPPLHPIPVQRAFQILGDKDKARKPICGGVPGFLDQMAFSFPCS